MGGSSNPFAGMSGMGGSDPYAQQTGRDEAQLSLSLEDAHKGGKMQITLPSGKNATINIPVGISEGQTLKLKGLGSQGRGGVKDLYVKINIKPHAIFKANGKDLSADVKITPWDAALGGTVNVPTLDGISKIKIPAMTHTEKRMKLSGKGLGGKGDLFVTLKIDIPATLTDKQKELFEKLKNS
ncbi:DnaJ-class molecular chaperone [Elusimicrobium posterum]|uniref:J domain-containing protein n=1 Tax=Elusimicrobium posterum TaxID=3116653 RepID=UPI003C738C11